MRRSLKSGLRGKVSWIIFASLLGCFLLLGLVIHWVTQQQMRNTIERQMLDETREASVLVEEFMDNSIDEAELISRDKILKAAILSWNNREIDARLENYLSLKKFESFFVFDKSGYIRAVTTPGKSTLGKYYGHRAYFQRAMESKGTALGDPVIGGSIKKPAVHIAVPIKDRQGEIQAVLAGALTLAHLSEKFEKLKVGRHGFVILISADGKILAHPDSSKLFTPVSESIPGFKRMTAKDTGILEGQDPAGQDFLYAWLSLPKYHWTLAVQLPRQEVYEPLTTSRKIVFWGILFILVVAVVTCVFFVDRYVLHPIKHIQSNLADITLGKVLSGHLIQSGDELQVLSEDISTMAVSLRHSFESLAKRNRELLVLNTIAAVAGQRLEMQEILDTTLEKTLEIMEVDVGNVRLFDPVTLKLTIAAHRGMAADYLRDNVEVDIYNKDSCSAQAAICNEVILVEDITENPRLKEAYFPRPHAEIPRSLICVPMRVKDKLIGTMAFISRENHFFTPEEVDIFSSIGHQLALTLQNTALLRAEREAREKEQARIWELSTLSATGRLLTTSWNLDEVLKSVVDTACLLLRVNRCNLMLKDERGYLRFAYTQGIPQDFLDIKELSPGESLSGWVAGRGENLYVPEMDEDPRFKFPELARQYGFHSFLGVPLKVKDKVIGVLNIHSDEFREFSDEEIRLLSTVGDYAAIAIEKARLFKELEEGEERLRLVLEGSQQGFWDWNIETDEVKRDERWAEMLDYTLAEIEDTVKQGTDLIHPDDRDAAKKALQYHLEGQTPVYQIEYRMRTKNRQYKWVLALGKIVKRDPRGRPLRMSGTHTDITDRKKLEAQILQRHRELSTLNAISSSLFRSLDIKNILEDAIDMILLVMNTDKGAIFIQEDGRLQLEVHRGFSSNLYQKLASLSPEECAIWQYLMDHELRACPDLSRDFLVNLPYFEPEDIKSALNVRLRAKKQNLGFLSVFYSKAREFGEDERNLLISIGHQVAAALENARLYQNIVHSYHQLQVVHEINNEISLQLDLEPLLFLIARRASELIEADASIIALHDPHSGRVYPKGWFNLPEEIKGCCLTFPEAEWEALDGERRVLCWNEEHDLPLTCESLCLQKVDSLIVQPLHSQEDFLGLMVLMNYTNNKAFKGEDKEVLALLAGQGAVAIQKAQYIKEIRELDEQRENYLSNVSHELRTPITLIRGYADAMKDGAVEEKEEQQACLEIMIKECDRLTRLVEGLLLLPRLEMDDPQKTLRWSLININEQLESCLQLLKPELEEKHIIIENLAPRFPQVWVDEDMIFQVILNLLNNALKFSSVGGKIILKGGVREGEIELVFTDTGKGISGEHLDKVFDKFYMIDAGLTRKQRGMGLGLFIVKKIVELHHGRIWVESILGTGTSFYVVLPRRKI